MKSFLLFCLAILITMPVIADEGLYLESYDIEYDSMNTGYQDNEWWVQYDSFEVRGIADCAYRSGATGLIYADDLSDPYASMSDSNCYCRVIFPIVSDFWFGAQGGNDIDSCNDMCAASCADTFGYDYDIRQSVFESPMWYGQ